MKPTLHHDIISQIFIGEYNKKHNPLMEHISTLFRRHALGTLELELRVSALFARETVFLEVTKLFSGEVLFDADGIELITIPDVEFNDKYLKYKLLLS